MKTILKYHFFTLFLSLITIAHAQKEAPINWNSELETYKSQLETKHIDIYNKVSKELFISELAEIKERAKTQSDFKTIIDIMKLTKKIGDGHTAVSLHNFELKQYPFELMRIENKWRVIKTTKAQESIFKATLIAIDGKPISEVSKKIAEVAQFVENEYSEVVRTASYMTINELLYELNITKKKNEAVFTFVDENNKKIQLNIKAINQKESLNTVDYIELQPTIPQIKKPKNAKFDYLWYAPIQETNGVYIQFDSYPSFQEMQVFGEELVAYINANKFKNLVIDMRYNGGGDLYVGIVLAYALNLADTINWKNGVYVLTSNITFSAGTSNSALFKQLLNAKIVGQPTGSNPSGYQDMDSFELPTSKLVITYSKRHFKLSETITQGIQPDIPLNYQWNSLLKGIDSMLVWIVNDLKKNA